VLWDLSSLVS